MKLINPAFSGIKNIIFDYGGVVIDIHYQRTQQAFQDLGVANVPALMTGPAVNDLFYQFETGNIGAEPFLNRLWAFLPEETMNDGETVYKMVQAWNAMLGKIPAERLTLLTALKEHYNTFLLSNTNTLHIAAVDGYLKREHNVNSIHPFFHKVYYSYEMGMRKPNADIYESVLQKENLNPAETLFIDDNEDNINAAKALGIHTIHLVEPQHILELFA